MVLYGTGARPRARSSGLEAVSSGPAGLACAADHVLPTVETSRDGKGCAHAIVPVPDGIHANFVCSPSLTIRCAYIISA